MTTMPSRSSSPTSATPALPNPPYYTPVNHNDDQNTQYPASQPAYLSSLPRLHPRLPSIFPTLPLVAAIAWFATVLTLLVYWLADGRPHLESMARTQRIAYISDVGAGRLRPLFITGGVVSGLCFVTGLAVERWGRHRGRLLPNMRRREKVMSVLAIVGAMIGSLGLVLLAVYDTVRYETTHRIFLLVFMMGVAMSAIFTVIEYRSLDRAYASHTLTRHLHFAYLLKASIAGVLIILAIIFATFLFISGPEPENPADSTQEDDDRRGRNQSTAAVFEWAVAFGYTAYLAAGWYDLRGPPGVVGDGGALGEKPEKAGCVGSKA